MKRRRLIKALVGSAFICAVAISLMYVISNYQYKDKFEKNTTINEIDCSELTIDEAKELIKKKANNNYKLVVKLRNDQEFEITGEQIGLSVENIKIDLEWIKEIQRDSKFNFAGGVYSAGDLTWNSKKLKKIINKNKLLTKKSLVSISKPVFNSKTKLFEREIPDYYLDKEKVFEFVEEAIKEQKEKISLKKLYEKPQKDKRIDKLNDIISSQIIYQIPNDELYTLDVETFKNWLVDGKYYNKKKWKEHVEEFVEKELKPMVETIGNPIEFKPTGKDTTITVKGGNYGNLLNKEEETNELKKELAEGKWIERPPMYIREEGKFIVSYVEVDLTRQTVWVYKNGNLVVNTPCVTGCVNRGNATPVGVYALAYKERDRILRGTKKADGSYEYESHVNYWMPFNGGIGLHDATWRSAFGGSIYISSGSHGCVNLPLGKAAEIYNVIDYNMPIIVYKS